MNVTHERCSELLPALVGGDLAPEDERAVRAHLDVCGDCTLELRGLSALVSLPGGELTELERARLHRSLPPAGAGTPEKTPLRARLMPVMGVAALAAVIAVGVTFSMGGDDAVTSNQDAGEGERREGLFLEAEPPAAADAVDDAAAGAAASGPPPSPLFAGGIAYSEADIERAAKSPPFTDFAAYFTAEDAAALSRDYARELAAQAPDTQTGDLVIRCVREVGEAVPYAVLPAFADRATVHLSSNGRPEERDALLLGFAWTFEPVGPLDRYMMWAWSDGRCGSGPLVYSAGRIPERGTVTQRSTADGD